MSKVIYITCRDFFTRVESNKTLEPYNGPPISDPPTTRKKKVVNKTKKDRVKSKPPTVKPKNWAAKSSRVKKILPVSIEKWLHG